MHLSSPAMSFLVFTHRDESITSGSSSDGIIQRDKFSSDGELHVYVEASNQHGSVRSQEIVIKAENISESTQNIFSLILTQHPPTTVINEFPDTFLNDLNHDG